MKIIPHGSDVFEFNLNESNDQKFVVSANSFEEAKKRFLERIEYNIEQELKKMFIEFNKKYHVDFGKNNLK